MRRKTREIILGILTVIMLFAILGVCSYAEHRYTREDCVVVSVEEQLVTVEDRVGYVWSYEAEGEAPRVGDVVDLKMYTNLTHNTIYDDEVVDVVVH